MDELQKLLLEQLGGQFVLALEGMLGEQWKAELEEVGAPAEGVRLLCWNQRFNIAKEPLVKVAVEEQTWREIGAQALQAVGMTDPDESDIRATYLELLTQALSGLGRFLTGRAGSEVSLEPGKESPEPPAGPLRCLRLTSPGGFVANLYVRIESAVIAAFLHGPEDPPQAAATAGQQPPQRAAAAAAAGGGTTVTPAPPSMEMLFDVEMPVSVSFGRTHLALKDVIKLSTGSIIELNRTISEPVEVIINNCVIARGEVVVVEGNYGVRIQHIVSRSDRLKSVD